ncbi:MAG: 2-oxo acid dehydrogenase subunit E2 [Planctomycetes bacterium]|nr:2-oxo acid dehydrogenase subunit E2 [Planctomycetota bacterium]NUQ34689.1 2-oxo acid dehydrogenase subunit E2 [Planctomycetaceae bacterium]
MPVVDMVMPKMGESVQEGTVIAWKVKIGDKVEKDQILLDIATDKVDTEVPAPASGTVVEILVNADQTVEVGTPIARIDTDGGAPKAPAAAPAAKAAAPAPKATATVAKAAPVAAPVAVATIPSNGEPAGPIPRRDGDHFFSPLVRAIAEEHGLALAELRVINGTGKGGRVTKNDLLNYISTRGARPAAITAAPAAPAPSAPSHGGAHTGAIGPKKTLQEMGLDPARVKTEKMNNVRKRVAQHMWDSVHTSPHVFSVHEVDMTRVAELRDSIKDEFKKEYGFGLTFTSFIIWAACRALRQHPWVNARINGDEIITHDYVNFGMAVALPDNGLIVPVIRDCENLTIVGIQRKIQDLATRARAGNLNPDEIAGGTFTLTNMGGFGTMFGLPIISQPQVAILGVGTVTQRPVIHKGGIAVRWVMYSSLAYDHRLVDGAMAANFLNAVTDALEGIDPPAIGFDRRKT